MKQSVASVSEQQKCCAGCGGTITERFYAKVFPNCDWHSECLRCVECHQQLSATCFLKSGRPYCKADYLRVFSVRCAKCGDALREDEYVMKAKENFYHIQCFSCYGCSKRLNMGDFCAVLKDGLYCRVDYEAIDRAACDCLCEQKPLTVITNSPDSSAIIGSPPSTVSSMDTNLKSDHNSNNNCSNSTAAGACASSKNQDGNNNTSGQNENGQPQSSGSHSKSKQSKANKDGKEKKSTRVRTVLNEKQLHTLRACYAANPRPDALMKDQLVEMTQLSPRVIRVWFQNKRCKDKKRMMMLKQMQQQQHEKQTVLQRHFQAMPLVAQQPSAMLYEPASEMALSAADIVAVQNKPAVGVTSSSPGTSSMPMWGSQMAANAYVHQELLNTPDTLRDGRWYRASRSNTRRAVPCRTCTC